MELNISKFLAQFFLEAREKLVNVQNIMVELEQNPGQRELLGKIQRDMHTIKGSSRMVGLKEISALAHRMEDAFALLGSQSGEVIAATIEASQEGRPVPDHGQIMDQLQGVLDFKAPPSSPPLAQPGGEGKKKFKLDYSALKRSIHTREAPPAPPPPPAAAQQETAPAVVVEERVEAAAAPANSPEKKYLKIESAKIETIINQLTDLLSKKYFFTSVGTTFHRLEVILDGFKSEWNSFKDAGWADFSMIESMSQIDNMLDLFQRHLFDYQRDYQMNVAVFENSLRDLFDNLLDIKLTPLSTIFSVYPRFVRDYAHGSAKKIRLFLRGGDIQLDKNVIERINEPLIHLVRNACDHGIEAPKERVAAGKEEMGTLIIEANKKGNRVEIVVSDDGKGLSRERILAVAVERGLVDAARAADLDDADVWALIFHANFSTAAAVTDISGRGVGMDVVSKVIHQLGGTVRIETRAGQGSSFHLEFPISIFTNRVMVLSEAGRTYAIPSGLIRRIVRLRPEDIQHKHDYSVVIHEGEIYTVAKLARILGGENHWNRGNEPQSLILPKITDKKIGIVVDEIRCEAEVIIKELGPFLGKRRFVYGVVIGERGDLQTVLDLHDIVKSEEFSRKVKILRPVAAAAGGPRSILVVDDSLLVREMERNVLENAGYQVDTAINGLDGVNKAISKRYDLILGDIEMPEMDGFEMIEQLRRIDEYKVTPIIVLSTREREEDKIRGIQVGANAWLQKQHFEDREFLDTIKSFIG